MKIQFRGRGGCLICWFIENAIAGLAQGKLSYFVGQRAVFIAYLPVKQVIQPTATIELIIKFQTENPIQVPRDIVDQFDH